MHIELAPFHTSRHVDDLIKEVETLYTNTLESGNRTLAMQRLRVPSLEEKQSYIVAFRVGIFVGENNHFYARIDRIHVVVFLLKVCSAVYYPS